MKKPYKPKLLPILACWSIIFSSGFSPSFVPFSLEIAQAQTATRAEADRLREQGIAQIAAGKVTEGTETLERAIRMYQELGNTEAYRDTIGMLFFIYQQRGAIEKLIPLAREMQRLNAEEGEASEAITPQIEALVRADVDQDYEVLRSYSEQELARAEAMGDEEKQIELSRDIARTYIYEGDYSSALASLERAERLLAARNDIVTYRIPILLMIGELYLQQGQPAQALTYFEQLSEMVSWREDYYQGSPHPTFADTLTEDPSIYLSRAYYNLGKYEQALNYAQKAIERGNRVQNYMQRYGSLALSAIEAGGDRGKGYGHILAGMALEKLGRLAQAEQELRQGMEVFEATRINSVSQDNTNKAFKLFDNQVRASSILQRVLLAQNKPAQALAIAEWGRARPLIERATIQRNLTLEEQVEAFINARISPEAICQVMADSNSNSECDGEAMIQEQIDSMVEQLQENGNSLEIMLQGIVLGLPTPSGVAPSEIKPPNVAELKQIAQSQQATIVEYSVISQTTFFHTNNYSYDNWKIFPGEEQTLVIWVISPNGDIQTRQIDLKGKNIAIEDLVKNTRVSMGLGRTPIVESKASGVQTKEQLQQLHSLLIDPIADLLPTNPNEKVVFVPHEELFLVPFAALMDSTDRYLIEKHTILTAPSIQALDVARQKQQSVTNNQKAVVVGNPTMPTIPQRGDNPPLQLTNLPGAEAEGWEVAQLLNTTFLTGNEATEGRVLQQLPNAQYIHLATHGLLEDYEGFGVPGAVALAPTNGNDGFLTASEIQELDLSAELAVLSACDTGRGDITGDGVVGLSRALIVAGVPSVVVSLWSVPDAPTAKLMVEFYRNFQERGLDKAQALRQAMLTMKETHPDPVNWAAFTLIGEGK